MHETIDFSQYFTRGQRSNGDNFIYLGDNTPQELRDFIRDIHERLDALPNDWIYHTAYYAFSELATDKLEDITIEADPYNWQLIDWLTNGFAIEECEETLSSYDYLVKLNFMGIIMDTQRRIKYQIYGKVAEFINSQAVK